MKAHARMAIAYWLLAIAYCLLPIAYCLLPIAYCLLPIADIHLGVNAWKPLLSLVMPFAIALLSKCCQTGPSIVKVLSPFCQNVVKYT